MTRSQAEVSLSDWSTGFCTLRMASPFFMCREPSHAFTLPALLQGEGGTLADRATAWTERLRATEAELAAIQAELEAHPAALVILDPLYLAAAGASGANLYDMGAVLQAIQGVCQAAGCALLVESV